MSQPLTWVRLDTNFWSHDKTLKLLEHGTAGYKACCLYIFALTYSGGHGTDGCISKGTLRVIGGTKAQADLLVDTGFFVHGEGGTYCIKNYGERQVLQAAVSKQSTANRINACDRWMKEQPGRKCTCGTHE